MTNWGKAGVRLTDQQAAARHRTAAAARNRSALARDADDRIAYRLWRAGAVKPYLLTYALDACSLHGPQVDVECGAQEPDVDLWEAGLLYPTWRQLLLLAQLTGKTARFLCSPHSSPTVEQTSMRFHGHTDDGPPRVWAYDLSVVQATVGDAPFDMPEER